MVTALLDGIRVLNLASVGPAARAGRWLADYGADVVMVAPVPSAGAVQIEPPFHSYSAHRFLRRIALDLKDDAGRDAFLRIARRSDVVIESFRPGVVGRLGIGYDDVRRVNPCIIYCSTSGYGQNGPRSQWAGHDLNYLAVSGFLDCSTPGADGAPPLPGATIADGAAGGMHAVMAILAALVGRANTGRGALLDVSIADGALGLMALAVDDHLATGSAQGPRTGLLTGRYACYDVYQASDGGWLAVAAIEPKFWANLCRALGFEHWVDSQYDEERREKIRADLRARFAERPRDEWVGLLAPADTCVSPVATVAEVVEDDQYRERGAFWEVQHPEHGRFRQVAPVFAGATRAAPATPMPVAVRDAADDLLGGCGYLPEEIDELRQSGALG